jgi:hypothetical protein
MEIEPNPVLNRSSFLFYVKMIEIESFSNPDQTKGSMRERDYLFIYLFIK